jgi:cobalt-zinc-cadmium efflux system outer membrane protein
MSATHSRFVCAGLAAVLVFGIAPLGEAQSAPTPANPTLLTLERLEALAAERNPTLAQASAEVEAAKGRAKQAGLWPNPVVGYTGDEISSGPVIRGGEHGFFVEQTIPLGGKLGLSRSVFQQEVTQAEALGDTQRQRVVNAVRMLYYETLIAARRVEVAERLASVSTEAVAVSRQLFNVGAADNPDVLESEIEQRRAQLALTAARNAQSQTWRRLAATVGQPELSVQPLAGSVDGNLPELDRDQVLQRLRRDSPELKAARAAVTREELAVRRAQREPVPDLIVRGGPRYNRELLESAPGGTRPVGWEAALEVGVTVPLFNRNQGGIAAAQANLNRARAEVHRLELSLQDRLAGVFDAYLTSLRTAETYRAEIITRAQQAYDLYLTRYREMAAAYPQVLVAQRTLVQTNAEYLAALDTLWQSSTQLQGFLLTDGLAPAGRAGEPETSSAATGTAPMSGAGVTRQER